jgi:preprotein translocase subunit SecE
MASIKPMDGKKWINAFVAILAFVVGYVLLKFVDQLSEWFDLEARIPYFLAVKQVFVVAAGFAAFFVVQKSSNAVTLLSDVYAELTKVVWPSKDDVLKLTVGIVVALSLVSLLFVAVDFGLQKLLSLLY